MTSPTADVSYVRGLLSLVTYRPGWTVTAYPTPFHNRVWLLIDAEVIDSEKYDPRFPVEVNYKLGNTTRVGVRAVVPLFHTLPADEFYDWLGKRLIRVERHESREFFQVGGRPWNSPHKTPQPLHDYRIRKHPVSANWCVYKVLPPKRVLGIPEPANIVAACSSWDEAYREAWLNVIDDDCGKGEDMVNG